MVAEVCMPVRCVTQMRQLSESHDKSHWNIFSLSEVTFVYTKPLITLGRRVYRNT